MREQTGEHTNHEELLTAIRQQVHTIDHLPHIYLGYRPGHSEDMLTDIRQFAQDTGQSPAEYAEKLVLQRLEGEALARHIEDASTAGEYSVTIDALNIWIEDVLPTPRDSVKIGRIDNQSLARSLLFSGSRLLENASNEQVDKLFDKVLPFFDTETPDVARKRLARTMHTVTGYYTGNDGLAKLGNPGHARMAARIFSEATEAGLLPGDFWYSRGVRSAHGQLQFSIVEGMYDQLVVRGRDIRPRLTTTRQLWEHIPNYCVEILDAIVNDDYRHQANTLLLWRHLDKQRATGSKDLPPTSLLKLANALTGRINAGPQGFGDDLDGLPAGQRDPLPEGDIHSLGDAMRRLLYITRRADLGEEIAEWQRYQDDIYTGTIEGLVGLLGAPERAKKVGGVAVRQSAVQDAYDTARLGGVRQSKFDWRRTKPGLGYLS